MEKTSFKSSPFFNNLHLVFKTNNLQIIDIMERHEVKCINKSNRLSPHERIENIGGLNPNGTRWRIPQSRAIQGIESGKWNFYVIRGGIPVDVIIALHNGIKYLKTRNDNIEPNNLLSLPECP